MDDGVGGDRRITGAGIKDLEARCASLEAEVRALKRELAEERAATGRADILRRRFDMFMTNSRITLPKACFEQFIAMCRKSAPDRIEPFLEEMRGSNFRELFESLFAIELDNARNMDPKRMQMVYTFERGTNDIAKAKRRGTTVQEMKAEPYRINREFLDAYLKPEHLPAEVNAICEVGPAWGGATHYFAERFKPKTYHGYEIDSAWCDWLTENYGLDMRPCDGETFAGTESRSMDIAIASSVLYFMPLEKQWSYLLEMARVLRPGGIAIFNARVVDRLGPSWLRGYMMRRFPKRNFGLLAQHCIDTAFPATEFELIAPPAPENRGFEIHRRLKG